MSREKNFDELLKYPKQQTSMFLIDDNPSNNNNNNSIYSPQSPSSDSIYSLEINLKKQFYAAIRKQDNSTNVRALLLASDALRAWYRSDMVELYEQGVFLGCESISLECLTHHFQLIIENATDGSCQSNKICIDRQI